MVYKIINKILHKKTFRCIHIVDHLNLNLIFIIFQLLDLIESKTLLKLSESPKDIPSSKTSKDEMQNAEMKVSPFTPLEAAAISSVLEECLNQLAIIGFIIPANVDPRWDDSFKTIDETYGMPDEPEIIFREDMGLLPIVPTKAEKLQRERRAKTHSHTCFIIHLWKSIFYILIALMTSRCI